MGARMTEREISERLRLLDVLLAAKRVMFDDDLSTQEMVEKIVAMLYEAAPNPRECCECCERMARKQFVAQLLEDGKNYKGSLEATPWD